jgi:CDP-glycerol glycerophosphotransferase (TagB/SpsB family)
LKLKSVISGSEFFSKVNIFKVIDYITFICLGHGVNYFKPFLYKDYYGCKRYDKIILPSDKVISIAKKYGWEQKNIIKMGLPKWDLFYSYSLSKEYQKREKCIFMMFTWRKLKKRKKISPNYFNNIKRILKDSKLKTILNKKNVTLYASLHHNLLKMRNLIKTKTIAKYIKQEDIFSCLMKCDLIISDFSSVIFDLMFRNKPFIIFIPDSDDKNLVKRYDKDYISIINGFKNNSTKFENIFLNTKDTINKIIYYIENDFYLDSTLESLYKQFDLNHKNNINNFIKY